MEEEVKEKEEEVVETGRSLRRGGQLWSSLVRNLCPALHLTEGAAGTWSRVRITVRATGTATMA